MKKNLAGLLLLCCTSNVSASIVIISCSSPFGCFDPPPIPKPIPSPSFTPTPGYGGGTGSGQSLIGKTVTGCMGKPGCSDPNNGGLFGNKDAVVGSGIEFFGTAKDDRVDFVGADFFGSDGLTLVITAIEARSSSWDWSFNGDAAINLDIFTIGLDGSFIFTPDIVRMEFHGIDLVGGIIGLEQLPGNGLLISDFSFGFDSISIAYHNNLYPANPYVSSDGSSIHRFAAFRILTQQVPEPTSLAMIGLGLGFIGYRRKKRLRNLESDNGFL